MLKGLQWSPGLQISDLVVMDGGENNGLEFLGPQGGPQLEGSWCAIAGIFVTSSPCSQRMDAGRAGHQLSLFVWCFWF